MLVNTIMSTPVITIQQDFHVGQALELMKINHIRHLPVVTSTGSLVGLVSESDLLKVFPRKQLNNYEKTLLSRTPVKTVMDKTPLSIRAEDTIEAAAQIMQQCKIVCLPVLENTKVTGIICDNDVLRSFINVLGIGLTGLRVTLSYQHQKGFLAELVQLLDKHNAVILKLVTFQQELVLKLQVDKPAELLVAFATAGYQVLHYSESLAIITSCPLPTYETDLEQTN